MQYSASAGVVVESDSLDKTEAPPAEAYTSLLSDLVAMIEHVQAGIQMIDVAIARQTALTGNHASSNVVAFSSARPRYAKAGTTLRVCDARLDAALDSLRKSALAHDRG